jgi:hypothetical protein
MHPYPLFQLLLLLSHSSINLLPTSSHLFPTALFYPLFNFLPLLV